MSLKEFSADSGTAIADQVDAPEDTFAVLDLAYVVQSLTNPRTIFNIPRLQELADSIKASGVHQPVLVRPLPQSRLQETFADRRKGAPLPTHELIAGARRYRASQLAGVKTIPAMIRHLTDAQVLEVQLIENLQRDDLHPMEEAEGYEQLCKATGISKEDVGAKVGKSRGYVYARLKLLDLTAKARTAFYEDKIDTSRALVIARIPDVQLQEKALEEATRQDYNGAVPSFRAFVRWAQQNVMLRLDSARFKITDASLISEAGDCRECTKRTGASPDLFADVDSADVCIDPKCFHAKEAAHEERVIADAKAKGRRIITEKEAKKLWSWEHGKIDGFVRADRPDDRVGGTKMLKTVLGKDCPEPVLMQNPHKAGELIEVLPADKVTKILKDNGRITPHQARAERVVSSDEAKRNAVAKYEKTWRKRAIAAVHTVMAEAVQGSEIGEQVCRLIASELLGGLRGDERQHVCELLGLGKIADASAIEDYLRTAQAVQAEQAMYLLLMQHDMLQLVSWSTGKAIEAARIEAVAADYQVALDPIRQVVKDEMAEALRPKVKASKEEEAAPPRAKTKGAKKSPASPAAQAIRAKRPSKEEVQADIASALQALDQAPSGANEEVAANAAKANGQAPDGAAQEEGAAPAALAPSFALGNIARVKAGSKGPAGKFLKTIGRVGRVIGIGDDGRIHLRHGERSHELVVLEPDHLELYKADPVIGDKVRVVAAGLTAERNKHLWRQGLVKACQEDGWLIAMPSASGSIEEVFGTEELEVLA